MGDDMSVDAPAAELSARWFVAHTRPRCERKLFNDCRREQIPATLPCYPSSHQYRGKALIFQKPLFPGYVFLQLLAHQCSIVRRNEHVANLLEVHDQAALGQQLREIERALSAGLEVRLAPEIGEGARVRIKEGPLRGVEGWIEQRHGLDTVLLRLDFINQAAAVRLEAELLEAV